MKNARRNIFQPVNRTVARNIFVSPPPRSIAPAINITRKHMRSGSRFRSNRRANTAPVIIAGYVRIFGIFLVSTSSHEHDEQNRIHVNRIQNDICHAHISGSAEGAVIRQTATKFPIRTVKNADI